MASSSPSIHSSLRYLHKRPMGTQRHWQCRWSTPVDRVRQTSPLRDTLTLHSYNVLLTDPLAPAGHIQCLGWWGRRVKCICSCTSLISILISTLCKTADRSILCILNILCICYSWRGGGQRSYLGGRGRGPWPPLSGATPQWRHPSVAPPLSGATPQWRHPSVAPLNEADDQSPTKSDV